MHAVAANLIEGGAGESAPDGPVWVAPKPLVVGIKQETEPLVETRVAGEMRYQDKFLKEPGRVREMPFCRARLGHGLDHLIFRCEGFDELQRLLADGIVSVEPRGGC